MTEITRKLRYPDEEGYENAETELFAEGERIGGAWPCIYNPAQTAGWGHDDGGLSGDSWSSWGPRGMSCGHPTRDAAEQAQIDAYLAAQQS